MSIKLAVDNDSNVTQLPTGNLNDIPDMMRRVADQIQAGEYGAATNGTFVLECESGVLSFHWGEADAAHSRIGLLESAKFGILSALHGFTDD